ncbi:hypothetical protein JCM15519_18250 [Fundidesulfovibrio butyratiphilus]
MKDDRAAFMGSVAAGLSHDLVNVLAIIQQSSGLLGDYLALARKESIKSLGFRPQFKYHDKFAEIIAQIKTQVERGQALCDDLNRLAHAPDEGTGDPDLGDACSLLAGLCARQARRAKSSLSVEEPQGERPVVKAQLVDVLVQMGQALAGVLDRCPGQGPVRLSAGVNGEYAYVDLLCQALDAEQAKALADERAVDKGCCLEVQAVDNGVRLRFARG